ncbi:hypothetical protein [Myroides odoratus]|uniref:hypothetical protein n=1 Tax=Myroides odoratus TaxID=256 RepID=UPI0021676A87|nr:hypothetical protein [Myroides odoratus]MCS4237208.1 hypothetical protein [Myroides odoratus]
MQILFNLKVLKKQGQKEKMIKPKIGIIFAGDQELDELDLHCDKASQLAVDLTLLLLQEISRQSQNIKGAVF